MRAALERHGGDLQETADELGCGRGYVATVRDRFAAAYRRLGTELPPYLVKKPGEITALRFRHVPRVAFRLPQAASRPPVRPTMPPAPVRPVEAKREAIPAPVAPPPPSTTPPKPASKEAKPRLERKAEKVAAKLDKAKAKVAGKVGRPKKDVPKEAKPARPKPPAGFVWTPGGRLFPESIQDLLRPYVLFMETGGSLLQSALRSGQGYAVLRRIRERLVKELERHRLPVPDEFRKGFKDDGPGLPSEADIEENRDKRVCPHTGEKCEYWRTCEFNHVFSNRAEMCENNLGSVARCTKCGKWVCNECEFKCFRKSFEQRTGKRLAFGLDTSGRTSAKRATGGVYSHVASDPYAGIWR